MADTSLILYPQNPDAGLIAPAQFIDRLREIGLLGKCCDCSENSHCYQQGTRFLELIDFSRTHKTRILDDVHGQLQQIDEVVGHTLSYVEIYDYGEEPYVLGICNAYTVPPLCPSCGYEIQKWDTVLGEWLNNENGFGWNCPQCHTKVRIHELDWRQGLGFARYAIKISEIWRGEAVPNKELLSTLTNITGEDWNYFYFRL